MYTIQQISNSSTTETNELHNRYLEIVDLIKKSFSDQSIELKLIYDDFGLRGKVEMFRQYKYADKVTFCINTNFYELRLIKDEINGNSLEIVHLSKPEY